MVRVRVSSRPDTAAVARAHCDWNLGCSVRKCDYYTAVLSVLLYYCRSVLLLYYDMANLVIIVIWLRG